MTLLKPLLLTALFSISAIAGWAQESEYQHREHLSGMLDHYLNIKEALAQDDFDGAQSSLSEFRKEVMENSEMQNHKEHTKKHANHHKAMIKAVDKGLQTKGIGELRSAFKGISTQLAKALENQGYEEQTLYLQYCPMAVNGEGAHWISASEKIVNPYMGQTMPGCGKMTKEVSPK